MKKVLVIFFLCAIAFACEEETIEPDLNKLEQEQLNASNGRVTFKAKEGATLASSNGN